MLSFHGKPEIKQELLENLKRHRQLDHFNQGIYWQKKEQQGCAIGCTLIDYGVNPGDHDQYPILFGIPTHMAKIEDVIFEHLSIDASKDWAIDFIDAIKVGVDLAPVLDKYVIFIINDATWGYQQFVSAESHAQLDDVVTLYQRRLAGDEPTKKQWRTPYIKSLKNNYCTYLRHLNDYAIGYSYPIGYIVQSVIKEFTCSSNLNNMCNVAKAHANELIKILSEMDQK